MSDKAHDKIADALDHIAGEGFKLVRALCGDRVGLVVAVTRRMHRFAEISETNQILDWHEQMRRESAEEKKEEMTPEKFSELMETASGEKK